LIKLSCGHVVMASGWESEGTGTSPSTSSQPLHPRLLIQQNIPSLSVPLMIDFAMRNLKIFLKKYRVRKANFYMGLKLNNWMIFCLILIVFIFLKTAKYLVWLKKDLFNGIIFLIQNVTWNTKLSWSLLCPDLSRTNNQAWKKSTNCFKKILKIFSLYYEF